MNSLGSNNSQLTDNTVKQSEERQETLLKNVNNLQTMESKLYKKLEKAYAEGKKHKVQKHLVKKINEISQMRMSMYNELNSMYKNIQGRVSQGRIDLVDQLTVTGIMEKELNNYKKNLNLMEANKDNKMRLVEINTYYSEKYQAQTSLMKLIILVCIPLLVLAIVGKKQLIAPRIVTGLTWAILIIGGILIIRQFIDINSRDNMNFQEYDWKWDVPADSNEPSVYEYDKQQLQGGASSLEDGATSAMDSAGMGCIGSSCCSTGTYYDEDQGECVKGSSGSKSDRPTTTIESFASGRVPVSYVEVSRTPCPFKEGNSRVVAFNNSQDNYVKVNS